MEDLEKKVEEKVSHLVNRKKQLRRDESDLDLVIPEGEDIKTGDVIISNSLRSNY